MTDRKLPGEQPDQSLSDAEIEEQAARLSEAWAKAGEGHRVTETGQILQTLEKGRSHMVAVEVKRSRRIPGKT